MQLFLFEEVHNENISNSCISYNGKGKEFLQVICEIDNVLMKLKSNIEEYKGQRNEEQD